MKTEDRFNKLTIHGLILMFLFGIVITVLSVVFSSALLMTLSAFLMFFLFSVYMSIIGAKHNEKKKSGIWIAAISFIYGTTYGIIAGMDNYLEWELAVANHTEYSEGASNLPDSFSVLNFIEPIGQKILVYLILGFVIFGIISLINWIVKKDGEKNNDRE